MLSSAAAVELHKVMISKLIDIHFLVKMVLLSFQLVDHSIFVVSL